MHGSAVSREATAEARATARAVRDNYDALKSEGFTEGQALTFLGVMMGTAVGTSNQAGDGDA